jgi:hypothetical protein
VLSGDVPSDCNLVSFRHARFLDFFNEIGQNRKQAIPNVSFCSAPISAVRGTAIEPLEPTLFGLSR